MMKTFKIISCLVVFLLSVFLQICLNPKGFNFLLMTPIAVIFIYFSEIKLLSFGGFSLEKINQVTYDYERSIIFFYENSLYLNSYKSSGGLLEFGVVWENYTELIKVLDKIKQLPENLQKELTSSIKESLEHGLQAQKQLLYGDNEKEKGSVGNRIEPFGSFSEKLKNKDGGSLPAAISAYKDLHRRYNEIREVSARKD